MTCKAAILVLLACAGFLLNGVSGDCKSEADQYGPCYECHDFHGRAMWIASMCAPAPCTDSITEPDKCCPVCPNDYLQ
ncbi:kielin/chordin-like protein isoform X2 [Physella acuta]|uniref:kielin/chordin-like protein isoform X2 n=1 Tax=Physella acuta TaxID=109671 RepID=UPI0027DE60FC|nr:kielin/chordin-like protein isoform X2 [Physella acuta]